VGNFRVTPDGKVAILDRNFFLELSGPIQDFVDLFLNPLKLLQAPPEEILKLLMAISKKSPSQRDQQQLLENIRDFLEKIRSGNHQGIQNFLINIRKNGLKLPLEFTLVFKNLNALQQMAKRAGFSNLIEAYLYELKGFDPKKLKSILQADPFTTSVHVFLKAA